MKPTLLPLAFNHNMEVLLDMCRTVSIASPAITISGSLVPRPFPPPIFRPGNEATFPVVVIAGVLVLLFPLKKTAIASRNV